MTCFHTRQARLVLAVLCLGAILTGQSAQAAPLDMGPRGGPTLALTCPPYAGGEPDVLCAPRPPCGREFCKTADPCTDHPWRCRIED